MTIPLVPVHKVTLVVHQTVIQNASLIPIVHHIKLVLPKNAGTLAKALVVLEQNVEFTTIYLYVLVLQDSQEIHSFNALK